MFTPGIGERQASVRAELCSKRAWLSVKLDKQENDAIGPRISALDSGMSAWVIPINEELS